MVGDGEQRPITEEGRVDPSGDGSRDSRRDERASRELEQQQLGSEDYGCDRCTERRRHAAGGATGEEDLPLRRRHLQELTKKRSQGAPGNDDRPLGPKRPTSPDGDRRRQRLGDRRSRRHPTLTVQDRLHRLRNAMPLDDRAPPSQQRHHQSTCHRDHQDARGSVEVAHRRQREGDLAE